MDLPTLDVVHLHLYFPRSLSSWGHVFRENPQFSVKELVLVAVEKTMNVWPLESVTSVKAHETVFK